MAKLASMTINRAFDHKSHGRIGIVEMIADVVQIKINGTELPASSIEYLLTFSLQNLQDAYAGADSADDAKARWEKKLARLVEGTIGVRESGDGATAEQKTIRAVLREQVRKSPKWEAFKELDDAEQNNKLDAAYAKLEGERKERVDAEVARRIAEAAKRKQQAKALADAVADFDI